MILVLIALESLVGVAVKADQFGANCFQIVVEVATVPLVCKIDGWLFKTKIGLLNEQYFTNSSIYLLCTCR